MTGGASVVVVDGGGDGDVEDSEVMSVVRR